MGGKWRKWGEKWRKRLKVGKIEGKSGGKSEKWRKNGENEGKRWEKVKEEIMGKKGEK